MMTKKRSTKQNQSPLGDGKINLVDVNNILEKRVRLKCRNQKQKEYAKLITEKEIVVCVGPAGTGKTYIAIARALELVQNKTNKYNKLILCKPAIEAEEKLGFLPGNIKEKLEPIMESLVDVIDKIISKEKRIQLEESGIVQIQPLGFIRGKTIDNAILVVDEAQNMTSKQMKTLLTRIGDNSKYIISGDLDQSDIFRDFKHSGLYDAWERHKNITEIGFFRFDISDIVRNPIIGKILNNYAVFKEKNLSPSTPKGRLLTEGKKTTSPLSQMIKGGVVQNVATEESDEVRRIKKKNKEINKWGNLLNKFKW